MNTVNPNVASTNSGSSAEAKQTLLKDIGAKWNRFSEQNSAHSTARTISSIRSSPNTPSTKRRRSAMLTP